MIIVVPNSFDAAGWKVREEGIKEISSRGKAEAAEQLG